MIPPQPGRPRRRWPRWAKAIATAVLFRLLHLALMAYSIELGDASGYALLATNLIEHGVLSLDTAAPYTPSLFRAPLYPSLLAASFAVSGKSHLFEQLVQVVVSVLTALLLARGVAKISERLGLAVMWVMALSPFEAVYAGALLSEVLCAFWISLAFFAVVHGPARWRWVLCGFSVGALALTRDIYIAIPFFAAGLAGVPLARANWRWGQRAFAVGCVMVGMLVVIAPWTARNYAVTGRFIPISEGLLGSALWVGSWADRVIDVPDKKSWPNDAYSSDEERALISTAYANSDGRERERVFRSLALARYQREPVRVVVRWVLRARLMWLGTRYEIFEFRPSLLARGTPLWVLVKGGLYLLNGSALALAVIGVWVARHRAQALLLLAVPISYTFFAYLPMNSWEPRYSQPVMGAVLVLATLGFARITQLVSRKRYPFEDWLFKSS